MEEEKNNEKILLHKRYEVTQRLASRPRLTLSLGRRRSIVAEAEHSQRNELPTTSHEPLVAIRELVLSDFSPLVRAQIEAAAIEEFAAPGVFGSSLLPGTGDRIWLERDKLYLALQLEEAQPSSQASSRHRHIPEAITLDTLLLDSFEWPTWLDERVAFEWSIQLCRMVARLHHQGMVLGNLNPHVVLVYAHQETSYEHSRIVRTPLLLPCWPPAPCYWQGNAASSYTHQMFAAHDYATAFPIGRSERDDAFAAPETSYESRIEVTERADVYSLGAILYLLLTHYAPVCARLRLSDQQHPSSAGFETPYDGIPTPPPVYSIPTMPMTQNATLPRFERRRQLHHGRLLRATSTASPLTIYDLGEQGLDLLDPRVLNPALSPQLTDVVMQALELDPKKRFASVFAMVEALESITF